MKEATHQHDLWRQQVQAVGDSLCVLAKNARAVFDDLHRPCIATSCRFKYYRREHCDFHFIRRLHPANQLIEVVQRERVQNFRSDLQFRTMQIVFAQNQAECLDGKKISAAGVAQNMAPSAGSLGAVAAPASHRRSATRVNDNTVAVIERCGQTGITIAAGDDFRIRPDIETDFSKRTAVFVCSAAS